MLKSIFFTFKFHRFCQSGFYFDFFYKKLSEVFVRNVFVYASLFFGEKFMIEVLTKKLIDRFLFNNNKFIGWSKLFYSWFFVQFIYILFYFFCLVNLIYIYL